MNVNKILSERFYKFFKYLRTITIVAFLLFIVLNAINTGNDILYWIIYVCLMISIAGSIQCVVLYMLSKYYSSKDKK